MSEFTPEQGEAIRIAHTLVDLGAPIFCAYPDSLKGGFQLPNAWPDYKPNHRQVELWKPGRGLAMVTGVVFDVLDVDPRNGGLDGWEDLRRDIGLPHIYGVATTPSEGEHNLIARTHLAKAPASKVAKGVDLQAGAAHGEGRGFIWIAPTVRESKYGARKGEPVAYRWVAAPERAPNAEVEIEQDPGLLNLVERIERARAGRRTVPNSAGQRRTAPDDDVAAFADEATDWTPAEAEKLIHDQLAVVVMAREGEINNVLGGAARVLGRFVAGGYLSEDEATAKFLAALDAGGVHSDSWNVANRKGWTAGTVIGAGLANGAKEPWTVDMSSVSRPPESATERTAALMSAAGVATAEPVQIDKSSVQPLSITPNLNVTSAADMAYWLQNALGMGPLSGFFLQGGRVVHTPRVDELGYVAPRVKDDENGPAQIQAVTAGELTAKIQYTYRCFKEVDEKDEEGKKTGRKKEVLALFPAEAARRAVDSSEDMAMLRPLAGITHTPMVRADGTVLDAPGYDRGSRYLFLPGPGVKVPTVPSDPSIQDVLRAVALLDEMTAGFPWDSPDDRANYYGLLLTPMLRMVAPPAYKMFGITAHQPGSGKTLLADVATALHGGVLRSEVPEDEAEWRKQATSILSGTSAPVIHVDNVTGMLKSSVLTGLLTADRPLTDRELGSSRMITVSNDRTWVVTGNNLSLGGDLVRRTVLIQIDPNMASPESREFAIADLKGWVAGHRNELLWALLVLIRNWVAAGSVPLPRRQSDSYARWEGVVAGILAAAGVPGAFDAESGKKAATGGDDDGLAEVLGRIWGMRRGEPWTVADVLMDGGSSDDVYTMAIEGRDWLPSPVLDKMARSEAAGRKSFAYWLRNRVGRWVRDSEGVAYVVRTAGRTKMGHEWKIESSAE
jgi:hypothetical protein